MNRTVAAASLLGGMAVYVVFAACGESGALRVRGEAGSMVTSPVPDADAQASSGSRLKARFYVAEDGSRQFIGWFDSQRNENCSFQEAPDGKVRCLPANALSRAVYTGRYYATSGCSAKLAAAPDPQCGAPVPDYIVDAVPGVCGAASQVRYYRVGPSYTEAMVYLGTGSSLCGSILSSTGGTQLYTLGAEFAPDFSQYVAATEQRDQ